MVASKQLMQFRNFLRYCSVLNKDLTFKNKDKDADSVLKDKDRSRQMTEPSRTKQGLVV